MQRLPAPRSRRWALTWWGVHTASWTVRPGLGNLDFPTATAGPRPWTVDGLPVVGPSETEGLWLAAGHEGDGVTLGLATAELLARRMTGTPPDALGEALDPRRFSTSAGERPGLVAR